MYRSHWGPDPVPLLVDGSRPVDGSRRRFVQGLAGGAFIIAGGRQTRWAAAASSIVSGGINSDAASPGYRSGVPALAGNRESILRGSDFDLEIGARQVNIT